MLGSFLDLAYGFALDNSEVDFCVQIPGIFLLASAFFFQSATWDIALIRTFSWLCTTSVCTFGPVLVVFQPLYRSETPCDGHHLSTHDRGYQSYMLIFSPMPFAVSMC